MPGLTRDRREGEAELARPRGDARRHRRASRRASAARSRSACASRRETALGEADLVLFLLDAREGVTPDDKVFAKLVRGSGRPVIVVANKCEGRAGEEGFYAAFELGFGEPVAISAEHGEGLGELDSRHAGGAGLSRDARERGCGRRRGGRRPGSTRPIRVAIVGRPNAGKSTLVNALPRRGAHDHRAGAGADARCRGERSRMVGPQGAPLRHRGSAAQSQGDGGGREAQRLRRDPRHPLRRGGRAARSTPSAPSSIRTSPSAIW